METPRMLASAWRDAPLLALRMTAIAACMLAAGLAFDARAQSTKPAGQASTPATSASQQATFSKEELAQLVAPVALYPDALLAQVLMASTYPGDIADAAAWSKAHPDAKGDSAVKAVANEPWDPSVQALVAFPQAVSMLGQGINWTQKLGDAFLAQPEDVMRTAQDLRKQAQSAGNLKSNEYQKVSEQAPTGGATSQTIVIESSQPDVIYVPSYNPTVVYGSWMYPSYPPMYYPPSAYWYPGAALVGGFMWGAGMAIAGNLWGDMNWGGGDININSNRVNNFNRNTNRNVDRGQNGGRWQHDGARRDGVPYRDQRSRDQYGNRQAGAENRSSFRGEDAARSQSREQARQSMERQGMEPARSNQQARDRANTAGRDPRSSQAGGGRADRGAPGGASNRGAPGGANNMASRDAARSQYNSGGSRNNAFSGAGNGGASRSASSRGSSSRSSMGGSRSGGGGGRSMSRPSRGGGGGGRRR
jgi:hypothetical protein